MNTKGLASTSVIFESPDNGQTVYVRKSGETQRELHWQSPEKKDLIETIKEDALWGSIRRAAKKDPGLEQILEQAKIYYKLKYQDLP